MGVHIKNRTGVFPFGIQDLKELVSYRDLLYMLIRREIIVLYKQTVLGFAWAVFRPFVQMVIFTLVFGKLLNVQAAMAEGVPYAVFSYIALVPWTYFAVALNASTSSLVSNVQFLNKVYFPRLIIPITPVIAKLLDFFIAFVILIALLVFYGIVPGVGVVFIPVFILIMIMTALGAGLWLSALSIQFRDVQQLMQFLAQLLMYAAPVIWPISYMPEKYLFAYGFYPMVGVIEGFRSALMGTPIEWTLVLNGGFTSVVLFVTGAMYFRSKEEKFADVA